MIHFVRIFIFSFIFIMTPAALLSAQEPVQVTVSVVPQKYFVERIGGEHVTVSLMVPPGSPPSIYEPKPRQIVLVTRSKIYFSIGVPFENVWLDKISAANADMRLVHTDEGIDKIAMAGHIHNEEETGDQHGLGGGGSDETGLKDPHIWLSPQLVKIQARHIVFALMQADPVHSDIYLDNYNEFLHELTELDIELMRLFAGMGQGKEFFVFHPAWGYFARDYGLVQTPIEIEGKEPKPADMVELIKHAKVRGIKAVFVQPQINPETASVIAREIGGEVMVADPLAPDWFSNLREVAKKFKSASK